MSMSTSFEPNETTDESRPLRKRVADNPDPARFWLLGTAVLVALEFGRYMGWVYQLVGAVKYVIGLVGLLPSWIGDSVGEATVPIVSYFVSDAITLLLLFGLSVLVTRFMSWSVTDRFDVGLSDRIVRFLERAVLTAVLATIAVLLAFTPVGGLVDGAIDGVFNTLSSIPTLTSREVISNQGHRTPGGGWDGTFLGLSPAVAWGIRTLLVYGYALAVIVWTWKGYTIFREHYRQADWTPRDDTLSRFRSHYWGQFGLIVVLMFIVTALWAPAISPTTADQNIASPYEYEVEYLTDDGEVATTTPGQANLNSQSNGQNTISPMSYDDYDRWAPLGTTSSGQNLLTHIAYGAQTSLVIGLLAIGLGGLIAVTMSMLTAYYKGLVDILTVIASDTIISIPAFLLVMMLSVIFNQGNHPIAEPLNGGLLLGLIFAFVYWPGMWRTIRGPSLQVAEEEWVDAARSYGQSPVNTMRKHMAPYIAGYIMIYGSLLLGGIIISTAALSFLGLGIEGSTPEWGRLVSDGRSFVGTSSWHVATIPGLMIVLVVTAFNALGDGLRDAIDPEADTGGTDDTGTAAAGGGG
ncbi:ABC transporter permease [Natrinema thermotolerans]|uniref:ABC transporter permease n=1 Tax=Natrinema thermotolerans TaxID=121872 RepID=A0AAF0PGQ8_9EURY|nr:ABC transporter permease [Natrinema thermotolerans]QCC58060.1 ABC transporter permease [Natrinema thermotolerans]WMT09159.1 ABC transporter permease [Natrinema thermotolerans]